MQKKLRNYIQFVDNICSSRVSQELKNVTSYVQNTSAKEQLLSTLLICQICFIFSDKISLDHMRCFFLVCELMLLDTQAKYTSERPFDLAGIFSFLFRRKAVLIFYESVIFVPFFQKLSF